MSTLDLLNAIVDKNSTEIFETFEQEMSARILDRLDDRRIEVAQSLFKMNENLNETAEEKKLSYKEMALERERQRTADLVGGKKPVRTSRTGGTQTGITKETSSSDRQIANAFLGYTAPRTPRTPRKTPVAKPEQGSTDGNTQYVSGTDKPIWEKLGGVGDLAEHFPEKNLNIHHEISHTDSQGNQHSFKVLGSDAKSILDLHKHMTTMGKSTMSARQHMLDFFEKKPTTESVKVLAQKARDIMSKSSPSLQKENLMVEQYGPEHFNQADHEGLIKRDSLYRFHVYDEARKAGISFNDQHSGNPKFHEIEKQQYANRLNADQQHRKLVAAQVAANPKGSSYDKHAQAEHDLIANQRAGRNIS